MGYARDVEVASGQNVSEVVLRLEDGCFRRRALCRRLSRSQLGFHKKGSMLASFPTPCAKRCRPSRHSGRMQMKKQAHDRELVDT